MWRWWVQVLLLLTVDLRPCTAGLLRGPAAASGSGLADRVGIRVACEDAQSGSGQNSTGRPRLHFVTYADRVSDGLCALAATVAHFGRGELQVMGLGVGCHDERQMFRGPVQWNRTCTTRDKTNWKLTFLESFFRYPPAHWAPDDYALFTDGFDVLVRRPLCSMLETFRRMQKVGPSAGHQLYFNGEGFCFPWKWMKQEQRFPVKSLDNLVTHQIRVGAMCKSIRGAQPYSYLNSGVFMGKVRHIGRLMELSYRVKPSAAFHPNFFKDVEHPDDQGLMHLARRFLPRTVGVDTQGDLFVTMRDVGAGHVHEQLCGARHLPHADNTTVRKSNCFNNYEANFTNPCTCTSPFLMHFNGEAKLKLPGCTANVLGHILPRLDREAALFDLQQQRALPLRRVCRNLWARTNPNVTQWHDPATVLQAKTHPSVCKDPEPAGGGRQRDGPAA